LTRRRPSVCARLAPIGKHLSRSKIEERTVTYDVIVAGLGGMGSATASQLAGDGRCVLGLERYTPPHEKGSSHGRSRVIRQAYFEDPACVPFLLRAYELWERIEHDSGEEILTITGGLMRGSPESEIVAGSARSAGKHSIPHSLLDAGEIDPDRLAAWE
jgi:sarcosine oxidase